MAVPQPGQRRANHVIEGPAEHPPDREQRSVAVWERPADLRRSHTRPRLERRGRNGAGTGRAKPQGRRCPQRRRQVDPRVNNIEEGVGRGPGLLARHGRHGFRAAVRGAAPRQALACRATLRFGRMVLIPAVASAGRAGARLAAIGFATRCGHLSSVVPPGVVREANTRHRARAQRHQHRGLKQDKAQHEQTGWTHRQEVLRNQPAARFAVCERNIAVDRPRTLPGQRAVAPRTRGMADRNARKTGQ